jgi:hypothetical protein
VAVLRDPGLWRRAGAALVLLGLGPVIGVLGCTSERDQPGRGSDASAGRGEVASPPGGNAGGPGTRAGWIGRDTDTPGGGAGSNATAEGIPLWEAHIRGDVHRRMIVEVDVARGFAPEHGVMQQVFDGYAQLLDKPGGIEIVFDEELEPVGSRHAWTFAEQRAYADAHLTLAVGADEAHVHVMWVDGHDADDDGESSVLGVAWGHRHVMMYKQTLAAGCDALLSAFANQLCRSGEVAVMTHEMGHVIGLVDNGLPMIEDHRDPEHEHHDANPASVMYWQHERDRVFDMLLTRVQSGGDPSLGFDPQSLADIAAVRDR